MQPAPRGCLKNAPCTTAKRIWLYNELLLHMQKRSKRYEVRGLRLGQRQGLKCLEHGVSLVEIEALFAGDVYVVRDTIVSGER
jgi:hypothetical protein